VLPGSIPKIPERGISMKTKIYAIFTAAAIASAMSLPATAQEKSTAKIKHVQMKQEKEQHPEIASAMHHLQEAKQNLEHAAHDFGGHRVEAIEATNKAIEQLEICLKYDKD